MNKHKKKILFLATLPPPTHGASIMNQHVVQSASINEAFLCDKLPMQFAKSISDIGTISPNKIWLMLVFLIRLLGKMIRFRPSLVYFTLSVTGGAFYRDALFALVIKLFRGRIVYHLHGKGFAEDCRNSSVKRSLVKFIFRNEYLIILGQSLSTDIEELYQGKPFILPNGISITSHQSHKSSQIPVFLYLSNLLVSKGIGIFLESLKTMHDKGIQFKAIVAGASADMTVEDVKTFVSKNQMENEVNVCGPLYGQAKQQVLADADILVFPTWYKNEAAPLTILEAMQAELAVITTDNGSISEIVDNERTGFVVPQKDKEAITRKMELLTADTTLRKKMGEAGRKKFLDNYTLPVFEKNLLNIFHQILN